MLASDSVTNSRFTARAAIIPAALAALAMSVWAIGDANAETFQADAVEIENMPGNLVVEITQGTLIEIEISGPAIATARVDLRMIAGFLRLDYEKPAIGKGPEIDVVLRIPEGMPLTIDDFSGTVDIGDLNSHLILRSGGKVVGKVGAVRSAEIQLNGGTSGLAIGDVSGALEVGINGNGDARVGSAGATEISINGAGDVVMGQISGNLDVRINGGGDVVGGRVSGTFSVAINGSGKVISIK